MIVPKIRKVYAALGTTGATYEVGENGVTEIRDASLEFRDSFHSIINIMRNDVVFVSLVGVPVIITYFEEENNG